MSRQPPLPRGPPPRGPPPPSLRDNYRPGNDRPYDNNYRSSSGNVYGAPYGVDYPKNNQFDSYVPPPRDRGPPAYQFRGNRQRSPPRRYSPPYSRPNTPPRHGNHDQGDHYRPGPDDYRGQQNVNDFSFRHDAPPSIASHPTIADSYVPRRDNASQWNDNDRVNARQHIGPQRSGFRGRGGPRIASDRAFLKGNREPTPELMNGMVEDESKVKYIPIQDVSDSSEAEMDMSEDDDEATEPKKKQARITKPSADGDSVPKWSNPDPYFALPPIDETSRRKKDVVKLIRKARVEAATANKTGAAAAADDFIAFNFGDEPDDKEVLKQGPGVEGAPTGPRAQNSKAINDRKLSQNGAPKQSNLQTASNPELGSRKRTIRDEIKDTPTLHQALAANSGLLESAPNIHSLGKGKKPPSNGSIQREWVGSKTPWIDIDHCDTAKMGVWLHKEIVDFYLYVKPRNFEEFIRAKLVEDLQHRVRYAFAREGADILTFGSFPAGLYLPTADMDLVCVSNEYMQGGRKIMGQTNSAVRKFANWLERENLVAPNSMECILKAKVPLVKYVDRLTGLKVDISFENDTGLVANKTFQTWKQQQPAMPVIVTLIKHFLAMRGLNEPVNGGIGGFSVICLVQSLLNMLPQVGRDQTKLMVPEHHLGEILMEFLDLYGNQFNFLTTAIQLNPHGYCSKAELGTLPYNKNGPRRPKICIIDPNRPDNDISGGSTNTPAIVQAFSNAFRDLQQRMAYLQRAENRSGESILKCMLGGNYKSFELQRKHLRHVHERLYGPVDDE
ncbi:hypothetical protein B0O99DRAFT_650038 [Bisporella sp. PMI_857]|nr:hypothetical protein B0O99DRAFT_650038 [Bisporella sp. PMI_857]